MTTYEIKPVFWTCPASFKTRKAYRLYMNGTKLAAWSWNTAKEAKAAAERLASHWSAPFTIVISK